jgi:alanine dehydrogenase
MLVLTERDVRALLSMDDLISAMQEALAELAAGRVAQPLRTVLEVGAARAFFGLMPASMPSRGALGAKLVTVFHDNHAKGLPSHLATILLLDDTTGELLAVMDGRYITEARTAAVSAVSAKLMAREDAGVLAIFGAGVQARSHLLAFDRVRPLREVRIWSPTASHREAMAAEMRPLTAAAVTPVAQPRDAAVGADMIVLATASRVPVIEDGWVAAGTHIAAVGACRPDQREMPGALVGRARLVVDSRAGAMAEAGDVVLAIEEGALAADGIAAELGELAGGAAPGRTSDSEITIFKSLGMAVEDIAAAHLAYVRATERGLGRGVPL